MFERVRHFPHLRDRPSGLLSARCAREQSVEAPSWVATQPYCLTFTGSVVVAMQPRDDALAETPLCAARHSASSKKPSGQALSLLESARLSSGFDRLGGQMAVGTVSWCAQIGFQKTAEKQDEKGGASLHRLVEVSILIDIFRGIQ